MFSYIAKGFQYIKLLLLLSYINIKAFIFGIRAIIDQKMSCWERISYFSKYLRIKPHVTEKSKELQKGKTMFLSNHRSWADFFVDGTLCGGASYVARRMVAVAVPGMVFTAWINNYVWLFHRKKNISRQWFTEFFRKNWELRPLDGVIVYPEGHRYTGERSLPIKTGALEVAYNLKVPTQLVLSLDKENILCERTLTFNFDVPIYTSISEVLHPEEYETKEAWFEKIRQVWEATLDDLEESREKNRFKACSLPLPGIAPEETHYYPVNNQRVLSLFSIVAAIVASGTAIIFTLKKLF